MSVEVTITNEASVKIPVPIGVMLGDELSYGTIDIHGRLQKNETSKYGFTAYLKDRIGRGITADWNASECECINVKLFTPTCHEEIEAFYRMIKRITDFWKSALFVDGIAMDPDDFLGGILSIEKVNDEIADSIFESIVKGERRSYVFNCALIPLHAGPEEAMRFRHHPEVFFNWMHDKQSMDIYYAAPAFYRGKESNYGRYVITENVISIVPLRPRVPGGTVDPQTHRPLRCDSYVTAFYSPSTKDVIGTVDYSVFLQRLPRDKVIYFDYRHMIVFGLTFDEILEIISPEQ